MVMSWTAAKLHWIFLVRIGCALCVFSITRAKMKSVQRQQQPAKESSISNAVIGSKRGPHTWNRHLFFSSSELLTSYIQVQLKVQLIQKVWTQWHAVSSENVNQFFQRKSVCCCEGSRVTLMSKAMKIVFLFKQDNVSSLPFEEKRFIPILGRM